MKTIKLIILLGCIFVLASCANLRLSPGHFAQFYLTEPEPRTSVNEVNESCAATAEGPGTIPSGYRRMPASIANCTEHAPETLLDYSLWDGIDLRAQPGYDLSYTCWRLQDRFRNAARRLANLKGLFADARRSATIKRTLVQHMEDAAVLYYWNQGGNFSASPINGLTLAHASAMADLAVTGRTAYAAFYQTMPVEEGTGTADRHIRVSAVREKIRAQNPRHVVDDAEIERAINHALDRAYTTLWAIQGPIAERRRLRSELGYIAISADEDPPHRPLNVFSPDFSPAPPVVGGASVLPDLDVHQQNVQLSVPIRRADWSLPAGHRNRGVTIEQQIPVNLRYLVIVDAADELITRHSDTTFNIRSLPPHDVVSLPDDYDVILMLHGHSSRAEEAMDLARSLIHEWKTTSRRKLAVIALDLPSNGYSQMIDHRAISDVNPDGSTRISEFNWHDASFVAYFPTLDFIENSVIRFVEQLDRVTYFRLKEQIKAVIGGSLGGNLGLRLSWRSKDSYPYLRNIVSWSPASTWGDSWARARSNPLELFEDGTYFDIAKSEAKNATRNKYRDYDTSLLSSDGRVERGNRKLEYFVGVFTTSGTIFEAILENEFPPQGDRWYREGWACKNTYLKGAIFDRWEIYNKLYRLWHWRVAHEQLIFMHNEPSEALTSLRGSSGGRRSYERFSSHLLLAAGKEDNHVPDKLYDNTRKLAQRAYDYHLPLVASPRLTGRTLWLEDTGHSIHNERPNLLAQRIRQFLYLRRRD